MVFFLHRNHSKSLSISTLLKSGFTPTLNDFNDFLIFLTRNQRFNAIIHFFSQLTFNKIKGDSQTHTIFTKALIKEHKYEAAADFLRTHLRKSKIFDKDRIFDSIVQGVCIFSKEPEKGLSLLTKFLKMDGGIFPSSYTFCSLIYSFSSIGKLDRVVEVLELMSDEKLNYPFNNFVSSSVISGFVRIGKPELAVGFFENAVKSGSLKPNVVTCTALMSAYCKLRRIDDVLNLVTWMENNGLAFDVEFYSNWIYGCLREGIVCEAFQKYREMVDRKLELDAIGYTILIDGFAKDGNVEKAVGFLYKMRKDGVEPNLVTYTAIIMGFCKKGKLQEAFAMFRMIVDFGIEVDEFTYAILIDGVCRRGDFEGVLQLLDEMVEKGINPSVITYNTVINGLCKAGRMSEADDFSKGIVGDVITYTTLLHGYVEERSVSGILETKRRLEMADIQMDAVMCNILIKALVNVGLFEDAFAVYNALPKMNLSADSVTYCTLIEGYCKAGRIDEALEMFNDFRKSSNFSAASYYSIIFGLCRKGMVDIAIDIYMEYIERGLPLNKSMYQMLMRATFKEKGADGLLNVIHGMENVAVEIFDIICNDAICLLCKKGFPEAACSALLLMRRKESMITSKCYYSILRLLLFYGKKSLAQPILTDFVKVHGMSDLRVSRIILYYLCFSDVKNALKFLAKTKEMSWSITIPFAVLETLAKDGRVLDAYELLVGAENNAPVMNVVDYSVIIDALCKEGHIDKALDLCCFAKNKRIALNIVTYNSVIKGLCRQGCLVEAFRLFDALEKIDVVPSEITYGTLIDALTKERMIQDARMLFEKMFLKNLRPNAHIYNSLINGYCKSNLLEEALKLLEDLRVRHLKPDGFTVGALINGYCLKSDMEGALKFFLEFKNKGLLPDFLGFMFLIRGLCAKGRMEESRSILREMLQAESVIDLLRRVDSEVESESVERVLTFLCEQGSIVEAVAVLDEVGSMFFSSGRSSRACNGLNPHDMKSNTEFEPSICHAINLHAQSCGIENLENMPEFHDDLESKTYNWQGFDSYYALVYSLCSKGELSKANRLAKKLVDFG
ncbi:pentatricopeptide repeat-containing At5g57250, mitochondrial [Olea europaea subsp. europaea]|uniref:Pentatricopeptide repeat-containing At5g57250, mitochondrial n=1 Tax=Olea europaea subsp. europaea TaxID=158383 RepID=A0A8S0PI16_OLEEU|nr:pentatricopeptide repeat-containing At5g57250, mitochondrial [Olea europaea subsp. europaea]